MHRRFVTNSVEDETGGNATEAPVDFASAEPVAASVLCAQPEKVFCHCKFCSTWFSCMRYNKTLIM